MVIGSFIDLGLIDPIFSLSSMKGKNVNSIVEPYAMHKKCLYGCSILSLFSHYLLSRLLASSGEIEEPFYHQGNDPSTR